ncbi:FlgD immunoglobulin-like domain containing protein [Haloferula sp. BvORR071]|uniref:FlgD immunoglobulin-like domain containing protein n=1 Tax=Haloferula sp. BvORR071 TaxID=1396141 RepID=UPI000698FBFD|nr:FlgD immunoglobulin-like domain containing protein [Haloferula sp. BvORR071]
MRSLLPCYIFLLAGLGPHAGAEVLTAPPNLTLLSSPLSPRVAFDAVQRGKQLSVSIEVESFAKETPELGLGLAGDHGKILLGGKDAKLTRRDLDPAGGPATTRWTFNIPEASLINGPKGWQQLRMGLAVEWPGGPLGQARQRERFLHLHPAAAHAGLALDPAEWRPLDLKERARLAEDHSLEIAIDFQQPIDGKATLVIENEAGQRVKNLVSGQTFSKGPHRIVWDGLDENGNVAAPGEYRWRAISHPGLKPVHAMDFCDGPGSNHGTFQAAATNGSSLFFGSPVAEGGYEIVELAADGSFIRGFNPPHGHGLGAIALAADENYLYAAHDGLAWGEHIDRSKADWKETRTVSLMRIDLKTGVVADFADKQRHATLWKYEAGPGSNWKSAADFSLAGMALAGGQLFLADRGTGKLRIVSPTTAKLEREFPLEAPEALASFGESLFTIAKGQLSRIDPKSGKLSAITKIGGKPSGLVAAEDSTFFVSDREANVVQIFGALRQRSQLIGKPGGIEPGPYDPLKLQNPAGLVALDGKLWITERDRWQPKRLAAFDIANGAVVQQYFGPTNYGAQGAGFDPLDPTRWIGQGALWKLDFAAHTATPTSILGGKSGRRHSFYRQGGRTFILSSGKATWIQELLDDGTLHPRACISSAHQFSYDNDWRPPQAFIDAFHRDYPNVPYGGSQNGSIDDGKPNHGYGMLWVDRNGNETMEAEEIEFATAASNFAGAGWSHDFHDLTLRVPAEREGKPVMVTLKPDGWWPGDAPRYPALNDAVRAAVPIDLPGSTMVESITDSAGNMVVNSDPSMRCFAPDGSLRWSYPNRWSNVHGSHKAPLPSTGELQGSLFYSGMAPLDDKSDVMLINGNHGRAFVMSSDGLYLDEMFPDVRMMNNAQATGVGILGGECFGGTFGKANDGCYYFQGGGIAYRIYRVEGLNQTQRAAGKISVSGPQALAAARNQARKVADSSEPATVKISRGKDPNIIAAKWEREGQFPVTVKASQDGTLLYLQYEVADSSPWINQGKDWQALFKTGDSIDFQLGTNPAADPKRSGPAPGDLRLLIAPMGDENLAVLYRHRLPGAPATEAVNFQSPWRSEKVDSVRRLDFAKIEVQRGGDGYKLKLSVPLADLGLSNPTGLILRGDFGVIYGDPAGSINTFRNYHANRATGLVNDVPGEIMLSPDQWGEIRFEP